MSRSFTRRDFLSGSLGVGAAGALHTDPRAGLVARPARQGSGAGTPRRRRRTSAASRGRLRGQTGRWCSAPSTGATTASTPWSPTRAPPTGRCGPASPSARDRCSRSGRVDSVKLGLHPSLVGLKSLWDAGQVAIILGVGYPNPNYSHFQSMEIMQSADPTGDSPTGWLGRWLDASGSDPTRVPSRSAPQLPQVFTGARQQASTLADSHQPRRPSSPDGDPHFIRAYAESSTSSTGRPSSRRRSRQIGHEPARRRRQGCLRAQLAASPRRRSATTTPATSAPSSTSSPSSSRRACPPRPTASARAASTPMPASWRPRASCSRSSTPASRTSWAPSRQAPHGLSPVIVIYSEFGRRAGVELERRHRPRLGEQRHRRRTVGEGRFLRRDAEPDEAGRHRQLRPHGRHPARLRHGAGAHHGRRAERHRRRPRPARVPLLTGVRPPALEPS